jgi:hypothetical protein
MSDSMGSSGPDLQVMYESLRSHATGQEPVIPLPQGLALLLRSGVPAWMAAWVHVASSTTVHPPPQSGNRGQRPLPPGDRELVTVLTEMVLGSQGRSER